VAGPIGPAAGGLQPPDDLPPPPDQDEWDRAAQEFLFKSLADIQSSAERWSTALGGLLVLFGTVTLVTGPSDIAKVSAGPWRTAVIILIALAGLFAAVALYLAAIVQLRPNPRSENWNGTAYQVYVISKSRQGARYLNLSRALGGVAVAFVFAVGIAVLINSAG
jgi:hypothetical protein